MRWDPVQEQPLSWKACSASWAESLHSIIIITIVIIIVIITIEDDLNADSSLSSVLELMVSAFREVRWKSTYSEPQTNKRKFYTLL